MFAPAFPPFANPEAIVNGKLALSILQAGWHVDIITRNFAEEWKGYNYGSAWIEPWLSLKDQTHIVSYKTKYKFTQRLDTAWCGLQMRHPVNGCRWASHAFELAIKLHMEKQYDVILSRSLPEYGHLPALNFARYTKLPWIANWNDANYLKAPPPAGDGVDAKLGFFLERYLMEVARTASWHTFPSDRMRHHICGYLKNGTEDKSSTIPHIALKKEAILNHKKNKVFTLCYAGNLYAGRDPKLLFDGLKSFLESIKLQDGFKLILVGLESIGLKDLVKDYDLENNISITGPVSYAETLKFCVSSDILIILEEPFIDGIFLPSKFIDYVQTGKPVMAISPINGTLRDILTKYGGGIAVDCTSVTEITNALIELYDMWQHDKINDIYSSEKLFQLFDPKAVVEIYRGLFDNLLHRY